MIVVQEAFGVTTHIEGIAQRLAAEGWHAVAPALFHREGSPVLAYDDLGPVMPLIQGLTAGGITTDLAATLTYLDHRGHPASGTGVVGFCMGGSVAFVAATQWALGAAVSFYGGGLTRGRFGFPSLVDLAPRLATPWLGLFGDADQGIPVADVEQLREATGAAAVEREIVRYPGAPHGFNCEDRPEVYDPAAAAAAWHRTLAWFDSHLR